MRSYRGKGIKCNAVGLMISDYHIELVRNYASVGKLGKRHFHSRKSVENYETDVPRNNCTILKSGGTS